MINFIIITLVIGFSVIAAASLWAWNYEDSEKGAKNARKKGKRTQKTNQPAKAKTDKKVRTRSK